jgi:PAS domain S-box-containing protein
MNAAPLPKAGEQARDLAATLRQHREEILGRWVTLCRASEKARSLTQEQLLDHLPRLLDRLSSAVEAASDGRDSSIPITESRAHALHRLDTGFDLPEITQEYALLRRVLFSILSEHAPHLVIGGFDVVGAAIDGSLSESVDYYVQIRHRTLEALDEVAQVVTGPGDVDSILHRLLTVTMQTIPSVDAVTVLLRDGDVLRVKEALGAMADRDRAFSLKVGEGFAGTIAATGQPMFLSSADIAPIVRSDFIRQRNIKAMYGVPMVRGTQVLGVAHMASLTAHEFAEEDQLLFRTIAERATSIIAQAEYMARDQVSRAFLETVIGNISEGVLVTGKDGRVVLASTGAARIFGTTKEELCVPLDGFKRFNSRNAQGDATPPALLEALRGIEVPAHDRIIRDAQGEDHHLIVSAAPVNGPGMSGAVVVFMDVTDRRMLENQLRAALGFRERMMGIVGHDLRTPMTTILMAAQSMLRREGAPKWVATSAMRVKRSAQRMSRMVSDLLDFTRIQANAGLPLDRLPGDLRAIVRDAVDEVEPGDAGRLRLDPGAEPVTGLWDADRVAQMVINLVNNALEHGSPDEAIDVAVADEGREVSLSVTNRGETIPPERLPTLFDPFRRAAADARGEGLGLGLHIVYEIAKAHGGLARVASHHGVTTFTVTLPKG